MILAPEPPRAVDRALRFIRDPASDSFGEVALEVFAFQYERNRPFRRLCDARGRTPATVERWEDAPLVPTDAFKDVELTCGEPATVFTTSGTTRGERKGRHLLPSLALYDAAWPEPFRRAVLPDRDAIRILSLIPSREELPASSLSYMADGILARFGAPGSGRYLGGEGLDAAGVFAALGTACEEGEPVLLLGTLLALDEVIGRMASSLVLPPESRILDTGGWKGRERSVDRETLLVHYEERLGIPPDRVVGEYGMTEMCSQLYENALARSIAEPDHAPARVYVPPPWVRTRVLDPGTLAEAPGGTPGLLAHHDLANAWTVASLVTGDLGVAEGGGVRILGRAPGAALRGCSLAAEELLG